MEQLALECKLSSTSLGERTTEPHLLPESIPSALNNKFSLQFFPWQRFFRARFKSLTLHWRPFPLCPLCGPTEQLVIIPPDNEWWDRHQKEDSHCPSSEATISAPWAIFFFLGPIFSQTFNYFFVSCLVSLGDSATAYPYQPWLWGWDGVWVFLVYIYGPLWMGTHGLASREYPASPSGPWIFLYTGAGHMHL